MQNQITELEIQNFKSIKHLQTNCKRINLFIGKPNVGKSNILEAISLLGAPYERNMQKFFSSFIRYERISNLFYDQELPNKILIISNIGIASLNSRYNDAYDFILANTHDLLLEMEDKIRTNKDIDDFIKKNRDNSSLLNQPISLQHLFITGFENISDFNFRNFFSNPVKKYDFLKLEKHENHFNKFLFPPFGNNLFTIPQHDRSFYKELTSLFTDYGLELVLRINEQKFEIQKKIEGIVYSYPYSTIADTLQRVIFYLTAIESNTDSVLLFEEPEAHAFPPYTRMLAERIVHNKQNQFFITTHSPYLLHTIIENTSVEELNLFITYFEDYQTKIKALSASEIRDVLDDSIDIFFNLDRFVANEA